jgi:hypothetical protein
VVVAFLVEQELQGRGLATLAHANGPFQETLIVDGGPGDPGSVFRTPDTLAARWPTLGTVTRWSLGARYLGTAVETTTLDGADTLAVALTGWIGATR